VTWLQKNQYYITNGTATICKVYIGDKLTYELWDSGKQHAGFSSADEAKQFYLTKGESNEH